MNKVLVAVFDKESSAYEGLDVLRKVHKEGDISLYSAAVIGKNQDGTIETHSITSNTTSGTAIGLVSGSLIGMLAGPAGVLAGASLGSLSGLLVDVNQSGVDMEFVSRISDALQPGKHAVIADIDETWKIPVDSKLDELGAVVFRKLRSEVAEEILDREVKETVQELEALEQELTEATEENKQLILSEIKKSKEKLAVASKAAEHLVDKKKAELDKKVSAFNEQIANAKEKKKAKIETRLEKVKVEANKRINRLKDIIADSEASIAY